MIRLTTASDVREREGGVAPPSRCGLKLGTRNQRDRRRDGRCGAGARWFALFADEPFDEGADYARVRRCGDDRTASRLATLAESPRASTRPTARTAQTRADVTK